MIIFCIIFFFHLIYYYHSYYYHHIPLYHTIPTTTPQRNSIGLTSIQYAHWFLKEMSEEVNQVITAICEEQCFMADKVAFFVVCVS